MLDPGFLHDPSAVALLPGAADGLAALSRGGWPLVVVSNQSGIARGFHTAAAFHAVMGRIGELLEPHGVRLAGAYFCPHHPEFTGPCDCRKPAPALFHAAARDLGLDLARSWYVGNRWEDVAPAAALGGEGILLTSLASEADVRRARVEGVRTAPDLPAAARQIGIARP